MSADIAQLRYEIDSSQAKRAGTDLDKMAKSARVAEQSQEALKGSSTKARDALVGTGAAARSAANSNERVTVTARAATAAFTQMRAAMIAGFASLAIVAGAAFSIKPVIEFSGAIAEVSTLVDTTTFSMERLSRAALLSSAAYGSSAVSEAKAFYQIISAGASSVAQASQILDASNRLAIGGVAELTVAADGLTSVLNAYGSKIASATDASDAMFVAMRAGKTTIGELASSLGKVAPLAATVGVSFDELLAAVSALTKGGISTRESVTGIRAVLAAVAKPSSEASKLAKQLGLDFTAAGLASKGFTGFMEDLVAKTKGSTDAMAILFGGVEALVPVMALSGQAGKDYASIMEQMKDKAGSTTDAFNKMANSPGFQGGRVWSGLSAVVLTFAGVLSGPLTSGLRLVADGLEWVVANSEKVKLATMAVGAVLLAVYGPTLVSSVIASFSAIITGAIAMSEALVAIAARNPFGALVIGISIVLIALYKFRDEVTRIIGFDIVGAAKTAANYIIGSFVAAYHDITFIWNNLGDIVAEAMIGGVNLVIKALNQLITMFRNTVNAMIGLANKIPGMNIPAIGADTLSLDYVTLPFSDTMNKLLSDHNQQIQNDLSTDYLGNLAKAASDASNDVLDLTGAMDTVSSAANEAGTSGIQAGEDIGNAAKKAQDPWKGLRREVKSTVEVLEWSKSIVKGFILDLKSGLEQGKSFWKAFGDAALNALDKIIDKLLDQLLDAIFSVSNISGGAGGGLMGFFMSLLGFANGGVFNHQGLTAFANGGVVTKPTLFPFASGVGLMGEAGPEAIMPLQRGPNGQLGVSSFNGAGSGTVDIAISVDDDGKLIATIDKRVNSGIRVYDKTVAPNTARAAVNQGRRHGIND